MDVSEKLGILADSAKYDVSCASSGSSRSAGGGLGATRKVGVCHSWSADGRCISLLKLLFSNVCIYDCAYCINRRSNDIRRVSFTVDELVRLTLNFYKRNYIEGLFLSSGVLGDPDYTMGKLNSVARRLRNEERFRGYIHLKMIPGASRRLIEEAGRYADRVSVNIELPSERSLLTLAPQKSKKAIVGTMGHLTEKLQEHEEENGKRSRRLPDFVPAGQSTQLIVGASPETDRTIMNLSSYFYRRLHLRRVYYSAFVPVNRDKRLPLAGSTPMVREHRLYQADWLIRLYKFDVPELFEEGREDIDTDIDPKTLWALRNYRLFPIEVTRADYEMLLRTPGIGLRSAERIVRFRRETHLTFDMLKRFGVVLKRARYFITCRGIRIDSLDLKIETLRSLLADSPPAASAGISGGVSMPKDGFRPAGADLPPRQLGLFEVGMPPGIGTGEAASFSLASQTASPDMVASSGVAVNPPDRYGEPRGAAGSESGSSVVREAAATAVEPHISEARRFRYDGTFTGLLTLLEKLLSHPNLTPAAIERSSRPSQGELFSGTVTISSDPAAANRVADRLARECPKRVRELLNNAFLSERPGIEMKIVDFCRHGALRTSSGRSPKAADAPGGSALFDLEDAERRLLREVERFLGLLRFRAVEGGLLAAEMEPECDILPLLAPSMAERMSREEWRIIDRRRNRAVFHRNGRLSCRRVLPEDSGDITSRNRAADDEDEDENAALWRRYVERIAVTERINPDLQKHFLPLKYRRYLTELNGEPHPQVSRK